ncbi:aromatic-ring-hydroxylating dioxygenase subunit beta [Streptomyces bathyalis]|uniref:aromatic-ring-hydroxylating dioxygenase subunit beta n=1 Tax=Streptomyces bathyalis TaxID=2710756 RepID=UPI0018D13115|nr:aromatic-ring-hydroxylating dioxygenase subunit beta [Streptomyces bathyalis]
MNDVLLQWEARQHAMDFLHREADLLDGRRLPQWLELLHADLDYRIPVRTTRERSAATTFSAAAFHMIEDRSTCQARVDRLASEFAWAEDPPSRTRRFVSNIQAVYTDEDRETIDVRSNLLVFRARSEDAAIHLSGERQDVLSRVLEGWQLRSRTVLLDHTALPTLNLAIFL